MVMMMMAQERKPVHRGHKSYSLLAVLARIERRTGMRGMREDHHYLTCIFLFSSSSLPALLSFETSTGTLAQTGKRGLSLIFGSDRETGGNGRNMTLKN